MPLPLKRAVIWYTIEQRTSEFEKDDLYSLICACDDEYLRLNRESIESK